MSTGTAEEVSFCLGEGADVSALTDVVDRRHNRTALAFALGEGKTDMAK